MTISARRRRGRGAFTLIEVLLVLVILVILAALAVPGYNALRKGALIDATRSQIGLFETSLAGYQLHLGDYPTTDQGLEALREDPGNLAGTKKWRGPYLDDPVPLDPWGNPYQYKYPGDYDEEKPDIWSWGPDGRDGTEDDIGSWPEE